MFNKTGLYYRTVKYLKPIQVRYRLWYMLRNRLRQLTGHSYPFSIYKEGHLLDLVEGCPSPVACQLSSKMFTFLNRRHTFEGPIDWNFNKYGKLWAYNLNYFDCLLQEDVTKGQGLELIREFIDDIEANKEGFEPYPISLRGINWIKFLSKYDIQNKEIDASLYAQFQILLDNLEYHILGNHLLENGCSLLFGAFYFRDEALWEQASKIISQELDEQILDDGGHYERSVMYHCIIMERLLDCYNLLLNNSFFEDQDQLKKQVADKAGDMLGWLKEMLWQDSEVPEVNDHLTKMQPSVSELFEYAGRLGLAPSINTLGKSGYRKFFGSNWELLIDIGDIGPDYVPGHAHSDIFSFLLRVNGKEVITDTGTSTYEESERRNLERSTAAHNTVLVEGREQNEVWSAFRVGRRGHVEVLNDRANEVIAGHDGYHFLNITHERHFEIDNDCFTIIDTLRSKRDKAEGSFFLHFYPSLEINRTQEGIEAETFKITFEGGKRIKLDTYDKALGYYNTRQAQKVTVDFDNKLKTKISIES